MNSLFTMHLHMLRATCLTAVAAIDLVLVAEEPPLPAADPGENVSEENKAFSVDPFKCQHPRTHWIHTPAMGDPGRMICRCGETMEEV